MPRPALSRVARAEGESEGRVAVASPVRADQKAGGRFRLQLFLLLFLYAAISRGSLSGGWQTGLAERHQQLLGLQHRPAPLRDGRRRAPALCRSLPEGDAAQEGGASDQSDGQRAEKP